MKKVLFAFAVVAATLMTACGGEKKEDKKEEKKGISEETLKSFEEVKTSFQTVDTDLKMISDAIQSEKSLVAMSNLDSLEEVVNKWPKDKKEQGVSFLDTLNMDKQIFESMKSRFGGESQDWEMATNMMKELSEAIEKKSIDDEEAGERVKSLGALIESFKSSVDELKNEWNKVSSHNEMFKSMNQ